MPSLSLRRGALALVAIALVLPSLSCSDDDDRGFSQAILLSRINLVLGVDDQGALEGLNLDDRVDETASPEACFSADGTAPDGRPGIDNQFASLAGVVLSQLGGDPDGLVQSSINDGRLLIIVELDNLDNLENDPDVTVRIRFGSGAPNVGTDGYPEPGQSFDVSGTAPVELTGVELVDGRIDVRGFDIGVEINILQALFQVDMLNSRMVLELDDAGFATGLLGGGIDRMQVRNIIAEDETLMEALPAVEPLLGAVTDLAPDDQGLCQHISVGFAVGAVPAFILE